MPNILIETKWRHKASNIKAEFYYSYNLIQTPPLMNATSAPISV